MTIAFWLRGAQGHLRTILSGVLSYHLNGSTLTVTRGRVTTSDTTGHTALNLWSETYTHVEDFPTVITTPVDGSPTIASPITRKDK